MKLVGVIGKKTALDHYFTQDNASMNCIAFEQISSTHQEMKWDVLCVLPQGSETEDVQLPNCRLLIIAGDDQHLAHKSHADCVMTYGKGAKNCLSISSLEGEQMVACVQRELVTLQGGSVERQEMTVSFSRKMEEDYILAYLCLALVLEKEIEKFTEELKRL